MIQRTKAFYRYHDKMHSLAEETGQNMWDMIVVDFAKKIQALDSFEAEDIHQMMYDHGMGWRQY